MAELKPGWRRVKLGDVALNSTVATKDPVADGFERYIIGKHISSEGARITTWNPVGDAEFGSRIRTIFRAGDVICTTRGPHLKVAVPDFDGLSAHTNFILRTREPLLLLQPLLEAVVRSDGFQDHLRKHFRGSTNLFVNWSDAAQYEFSLPPLEEQHRIIRLLTAAGNAKEAAAELATAAALLTEVQTEKLMGEIWKTSVMRSLPELCEVLTVGIVVTPAKFYVQSGGVPVLRSLNVWPGRYVLDDLKRISSEGHAFHAKSTLRMGDIAIVRTGDPGRPGNAAVVPPEMDGWNCVDLVLARPRPEIRAEYLTEFINWSRSRRVMQGLAPGTKQKHLSVQKLDRFEVPIVPLDRQNHLIEMLQTARETTKLAARRAEAATGVFRATIRHVFGTTS